MIYTATMWLGYMKCKTFLSLTSPKKRELQGMATIEIECKNNNMNNFGGLRGLGAVLSCLAHGFRANRTGI